MSKVEEIIDIVDPDIDKCSSCGTYHNLEDLTNVTSIGKIVVTRMLCCKCYNIYEQDMAEAVAKTLKEEEIKNVLR